MNICVDAGFLIALYDPGDNHHETAAGIFQQLFDSAPHRLVMPWPILYETLSTRMARRRHSIQGLYRDWTSLRAQHRLDLLLDRKMRQRALSECFAELTRGERNYRGLSLVDRVVRLMLLNPRLRLHAFISFNVPDFKDACSTRNIQLISEILE